MKLAMSMRYLCVIWQAPFDKVRSYTVHVISRRNDKKSLQRWLTKVGLTDFSLLSSLKMTLRVPTAYVLRVFKIIASYS
jgi:hypothetical protein